MKKLVIIALPAFILFYFWYVLVTNSNVWAAIYYVDNSLIDCLQYDPQTRTCGGGADISYENICDAVATAKSNGDIVRIMPGTYSRNDNRIVSSADITVEGYDKNNLPVIDGSEMVNHLCYFSNSSNAKLKNLIIQNFQTDGKSAVWFDGTVSIAMENVKFFNVTGDYAVRINTTGVATIRNVRLQYNSVDLPKYNPMLLESVGSGSILERVSIYAADTTKPLLKIKSASFPNIIYSIFWGGSNSLTVLPSVITSDPLSISNSVFGATTSHAVVINDKAIGKHIFNNCIWSMVPRDFHYNVYLVSISSDAIDATFNNCIFTHNIFDRTNSLVKGGVVTFNSCQERDPRHATTQASILIVGSDDIGNIQYFKDVIMPELDRYGWKGFCAINNPNYLNTNHIDLLKGFHAAGHDVTCHSLTHCSMSNYNGITVQYIGSGGSATLEIKNTDSDDYADEMRIKIDGKLDTNINGSGIIALEDGSYNNLHTLCTMLDNLDDYSCQYNNMTGPGPARSNYLRDSAPVDIKTSSSNFDLSSDRLFKGEVRDAKNELENLLDFTVDTWVSPGNTYNSDLAQALQTYGYRIGRGNTSPVKYTLNDINLYCIQTIGAYSLLGDNNPSIETVREKMEMLSAYFRPYGGIAGFYAHNEGEMTREGWQKILAEANRLGFMVMSFSQAADYILSRNIYQNLPTFSWYRCLDHGRSCFHLPTFMLNSDSPCIDSGTVAPGVHDLAEPAVDYYGRPVTPPVDIGPVEYYKGLSECTATLDEYWSLYIPYISFGNTLADRVYFWADFAYEYNPMYPGAILFRLKNFNRQENLSFSCEAATLSNDFKIHIPDLVFPNGKTHLWVDLEYYPHLSNEGNTYFIVTGYDTTSSP